MKIAIVENRSLVIVTGTFAANIAAKDIEHQFHALTHFPDRRANAELDELAHRLNEFAGYVMELGEGERAEPRTRDRGFHPPPRRVDAALLDGGRPLHELVYHWTGPLSRCPQRKADEDFRCPPRRSCRTFSSGPESGEAESLPPGNG